jgi:hypothetical protein
LKNREYLCHKINKNIAMTLAAPQYITDTLGRKTAIILSIQDYETLLALAEETEDILLYDEIKSREEERISLNDYITTRKNNALPN